MGKCACGTTFQGSGSKCPQCRRDEDWEQRFRNTDFGDGEDDEEKPDVLTDGGEDLDPGAFRIPTIDELDAMRVDHGLSQKELSRRAGVEESRFNHILHNDIDPQTATVRAFLSVLQTTGAQTDEDLGSKRGPKPKPSTLAGEPDRGESDIRTDGGRSTAGIQYDYRCVECDNGIHASLIDTDRFVCSACGGDLQEVEQ